MPWRLDNHVVFPPEPPNHRHDPALFLDCVADAADLGTLRRFLCAYVRRGANQTTDPSFQKVIQTADLQIVIQTAERDGCGAASPRVLRRAVRRVAAMERAVRSRLSNATWDNTEAFFIGRRLDQLRIVLATKALIHSDEAGIRHAVREVRNHLEFRYSAAAIFQELLSRPCSFPLNAHNRRRWFDSTVQDIARYIRATGELAELPKLMDALMDAGCEDEVILSHCRFPHEYSLPHGECHGCWVLDDILSIANRDQRI